jgi:hypothetical protein
MNQVHENFGKTSSNQKEEVIYRLVDDKFNIIRNASENIVK